MRIRFQANPGALFSFLKTLPESICDTYEKEGVSAEDGKLIVYRKACVDVAGVSSFMRALPHGDDRERLAGALQGIRYGVNAMTAAAPTLYKLEWRVRGKVKIEADPAGSFLPGMAQPKPKAAPRLIEIEETEEESAAEAKAAAEKAELIANAKAAMVLAENAASAHVRAATEAEAKASASAAIAENRAAEAAAARGKAKAAANAEAAAAQAEAEADAEAAFEASTAAASYRSAFIAARDALHALL